jgi:Na+/proline symporter
MKTFDWIVMAVTLAFIVLYGLWRSRETDTVDKYLRGNREMPWYAMALSIMATQASAITFISTTGQAYVDGMRFAQFYFGLPIAMILICMFVVPFFYRANVYTAYEYLEQRFDAKTRALVAIIFLIQRGLAVGLVLYAPAIVLSVILDLPDTYTSWLMGVVVITYTTIGGIRAITWTDVQQMIIMMFGLVSSCIVAVWMMPANVHLMDAVKLAGAAGRLNALVTDFNPNDRYNLWSGLIGGMFLFLAYFGCDQSQVQRYLTGKNLVQGRLSLLFNAMAKIPMQFFILFTGCMVFVFYIFEPAPLLFHQKELATISASAPVRAEFDAASAARKEAAYRLIGGEANAQADFRAAQDRITVARAEASKLAHNVNDTNYVFLSFVTKYLPPGLAGLILAAIFGAAMSASSAEINSLATVSVIDLYKRFAVREGSDRHYLNASRALTVFWGAYAVITSQFARNMGSLIEAVNTLGSLFYGSMLGVFTLAFFFPRVSGTPAFIGVIVGEAAIIYCYQYTTISYLWFNVIGSVVVVATGVLLSAFTTRAAETQAT